MAQKRKKTDGYKRLKLTELQNKKDYFIRFKQIIDLQCGEGLFSSIPKVVLDEVYVCRSMGFKLVMKSNRIPEGFSSPLKTMLNCILQKEKIEIGSHKIVTTLKEYLTFYLTLRVFYTITENRKFRNVDKLREGLRDLFEFEDSYFVFAVRFKQVLEYLCYTCRGIGDELIIAAINYECVSNGNKYGVTTLIEFDLIEAQTMRVKIDGTNRLLTRMGYAFNDYGVKWCSLTKHDLGLKAEFDDVPLSVYYQNHMLIRLFERIDSMPFGLVCFFTYHSFLCPVIIRTSEYKWLLEFRIMSCKAGYFVLDLVDNLIMVRTFLFLTNNGTPESTQLNQSTRLSKLDKKFLAIDKLSTFVSADFVNNHDVRKIFHEAGCDSLFELSTEARGLIYSDINGLESTEYFIKYLQSDSYYLPNYAGHKS